MNSSLKPVAIGVLIAVFSINTQAQSSVTTRGVSSASNTYKSFNQSSIVRDSEINQPLDLLGDFYPSVEVTYGSHDNVRRRTDFDEGDNKLTIKPSLAYRTNLGRHKLYLSYDGLFTRHSDIEDEDAEATLFNGRLGLDISKRFDIDVFGGLSDTFEERGVSGSRGFNQLISVTDRAPDEVNTKFYGADLVYGRKFSRLNAVLGFEKENTEYRNNLQGDVNDFSNRDREVDTLHLDLSYQLGAKTAIFGRIQKYDIDYERSANSLDSKQSSSLIGLRWKATNRLSGVIGIGKTDKDFDDPQRADFDGNQYYANLSYQLSPFSVINLNASSLVEEPGDDESDYYESELFGVSWDHALTDRWSFGLYGKLIEDDYNTERQDDFTDIGANLDYILRRWLTVGVYYGQIERDSNADNVSYEDEYLGIRVKSDLRGSK